MAFSFEGLHEPLLNILRREDAAFRSGKVNVAGGEVPFDAEFIAGKLASRGNEYATATVARVLEHLAADPNNHIVLRFKTKDNPDVIHIDSCVLEFISKHEGDLLIGTVLKEAVVDDVPTFICGMFDASFIAWKLGLNLNFVACALRRLADDQRNFLGLVNATSTNPAPIRDYGTTRDVTYAVAAER